MRNEIGVYCPLRSSCSLSCTVVPELFEKERWRGVAGERMEGGNGRKAMLPWLLL